MWRGPVFKKILELSNLEVLRILISDVVLKEVIRNSKKEFDLHFKSIKEGVSGIAKLTEGFDHSFIDKLPNDCERKIIERFSSLEKEGLIDIVKPKDEILSELIDRAVDKIKPFSEKKEEFRDGVIWLSCIQFALSEKFERIYFISKNISDFCEKRGSKTLHRDLKRDCPNAELKTNIRDFLDTEEDFLQAKIEDASLLAMRSWLEEEVYDEDEITKLLQDHSNSTLSGEISSIVDGWEPSDFNPDLHTGYVQSYESGSIRVVDGSLSFDVSPEFVTISGSACLDFEVEIYEYNPSYDESSEKYLYAGEKEVQIEVDFEFTISPSEPVPDWIDINNVQSKNG